MLEGLRKGDLVQHADGSWAELLRPMVLDDRMGVNVEDARSYQWWPLTAVVARVRVRKVSR